MKKQLGIGLLAATFLTGPVHANEPPTIIEFVRPLGMGGAFTAVADDHNVFTFNPAGMVQRTGAQTTLLELAVGASVDTKDAYDFIKDNQDDLENFDTLPASRQAELVNEIISDISKLNPHIYAAGDVASFVSGPSFLGLPIHVGFGAFAVADARFRLDPGILAPNISYSINNDIVLPIAIAHRWNAPFVPGKIGLGVTGKFVQRNQVKQDRLSVLTLDDIEAPPFAKGHGLGMDIGALYQPNERLNIGLMVRDFMGTKLRFDALAAEKGYPAVASRESVVRAQTNIGVSITPQKLFWILPTSDRWTFSADIDDIANRDHHVLFENGLRKPIGENFPTHFHMGAEFRYWFLRFRGGANQGYPTFGLGLDIPFLKLDYAFYSRELGLRAGDIREENHAISLALRFGSGATESRERIRKAKGQDLKKDAVAEPETNSASPDASTTPAPAEPAKETPKSDSPAKPAMPDNSGDSLPQ